jgi:hypothetical protein
MRRIALFCSTGANQNDVSKKYNEMKLKKPLSRESGF